VIVRFSRCRMHTVGVPASLFGKRWYNPGCAPCEGKLARGLVSKDDPTSDVLTARLATAARKHRERHAKGAQQP
jgi:hypothetical protein